MMIEEYAKIDRITTPSAAREVRSTSTMENDGWGWYITWLRTNCWRGGGGDSVDRETETVSKPTDET